MEEKKEEKLSLSNKILWAIVVIMILIGFASLITGSIKELHRVNEYKNFCEDKPKFCYCDFMSCEFKGFEYQSCINDNCTELIKDNNTLQLCEIAKKLNDKEVIFKANC
jgi:hypothetical protein